jgi:hypothetical protein
MCTGFVVVFCFEVDAQTPATKHRDHNLPVELVGCARVQAISRWLPTAAARVRFRADHVGFVEDKVALGQVFYDYFSFPCQLSFHQILHHYNHPGFGTIGLLVAALPSGPNWSLSPLFQLKKGSWYPLLLEAESTTGPQCSWKY